MLAEACNACESAITAPVARWMQEMGSVSPIYYLRISSRIKDQLLTLNEGVQGMA